MLRTACPPKVMDLDVMAVSIANHRGSVVAWNRDTGTPLCNVVLWSDKRTAAAMDGYTRTHGKYRFQGVCGLPFKIQRLIDYNERVAAAYANGTCCFGTVDSWLLWNLTGGPTGEFGDRFAGTYRRVRRTRKRRHCASLYSFTGLRKFSATPFLCLSRFRH